MNKLELGLVALYGVQVTTALWSGASAAMHSTSSASRNGCSLRLRQISGAPSAGVLGSSKQLQLAANGKCHLTTSWNSRDKMAVSTYVSARLQSKGRMQVHV